MSKLSVEVETRRAQQATLKLQLDPGISLDLKAEAKRRGVDHGTFVARILKMVVDHNLYSAVLDA